MPDNLNDPQIPCPRCKAPVPAGNKFCEVCGATMPPQRICPKCGTPAASAALKFCEQCGAPLNQATAAPLATPVPPPPPIPPSKPSVSGGPALTTDPEPIGQKADPKKPSWYIPPAGKTAAPLSPSSVSSLSAAEKPVIADTPKPVPPAKPAAPGKGIAGNKKIIIGAVVGLVLLIVIALAVLPALNIIPAVPLGPSTSVPAVSPSMASASSPPLTTPQTAAPPASAASSLGSGSGAASMVPGPTQSMPEATNVLITADKDVITGDITVQIAGGPGRSVIKEVRGTVYSSDGQTHTGTIDPALRSEDVVIPGSKGTDRVVVTVLLFSGEQYVVMDQLMEFRARR